MSDVNLVFTVNSVSSTFTVDSTTINVTPNTTAINMFAGSAAYPPNGPSGNSQVLFNDAGLFAGSTGFTYNKNTETVSLVNSQITGTTNLGLIANVKITGGNAGQYITTTGNGDLTFSTLTPGGNLGELQFNSNNTFGGTANITFTDGNLNLGSVSNVKVTGGDNGYVLQTDGLGNLSWTAQTGGGGTGSPGGSNSQVQYNNSGLFAGDPQFVFDSVTNKLTVPLIESTLTTNAQPNITSLGSLTSLSVEGSTKIQQGKEKILIDGTALSSTYNFDFLSQALMYFTSDVGSSYSFNIRGNATTTFNSVTSTDESITIVILVTMGATVIIPTSFNIDGTPITVKWVGGTEPNPTVLSLGLANSIIAFTYTILKTGANAYTVLAGYTGYK